MSKIKFRRFSNDSMGGLAELLDREIRKLHGHYRQSIKDEEIAVKEAIPRLQSTIEGFEDTLKEAEGHIVEALRENTASLKLLKYYHTILGGWIDQLEVLCRVTGIRENEIFMHYLREYISIGKKTLKAIKKVIDMLTK